MHDQRGQRRHRREAGARGDHGVDLVGPRVSLFEQVAHDVLEDGLRLAEDVAVGGGVAEVLHPENVLVERRLERIFFLGEGGLVLGEEERKERGRGEKEIKSLSRGAP